MRQTSEYLWFLKNLPPDIVNLGGTTPQIPPFIGSLKNEIVEPFSVDNIPALTELKKTIAQMSGWSADGVHISPGVTAGIFGLLSSLTDSGDRILMSSPYYEPFVAAAHFLGLKIDYFDPRTASSEKAYYSPYKLILLTNPNCFTGLRADSFILKLATLTDSPIIVDEIYRPFSDNGQITFLKHPGPANLISVGGFSKPTGITNLRIGWVLGSPEVVEALKKWDLFIHTDMPGIAVKAALNVIKSWREIIDFHLVDFEKKRQALAMPLKEWDLELGSRHFFDIPVPRGFSSDRDFVSSLKKNFKIYVTEGSFFGAPGRLRISLTGELSQLERLFNILHTVPA